MTYGDDEIDGALERIASDVARRSEQPEFHGPRMTVLLDDLRAMESARRAGDSAAAARYATDALPVLESYRPTNATSRAKALIAEVVAGVLAEPAPPS